MPFTISHTAAALPLLRFQKHIARSALVIGCMIPDLPLFLEWGRYSLSHSAKGIIVFSIPVGFAVWILWRFFLREPLRHLCPAPLRTALFTTVPQAPMQVFTGLGIGAATHVFWDGFTHLRGFAPSLFPVLLTEVFGTPLFYWLQHGSSVLGLAVVIAWLVKKWDSNQADHTAWLSLSAWWGSGLLAVLLPAISLRMHGPFYLYSVVVMSVQLFGTGTLIACGLWHLRQLLKRTHVRAGES